MSPPAGQDPDDDGPVTTDPDGPAAETTATPDDGQNSGVVLLTDDSGGPMRQPRHVVAFASGRGGTGKSVLAANVAVYLAQLGKRVVALDADLAGGTLHDHFGMARPARGLAEFLRRRTSGLAELTMDTPIPGLGLVGSEAGTYGVSTAIPRGGARPILGAMADLAADYVVIDLGNPDHSLTLDLWLAASVPVVVTLAEPAAVDATYRFIKSAFVRSLRQHRGLDRFVSSTETAPPAPPAPLDIYRTAVRAGNSTGRLGDHLSAFRPTFVVNQTRFVSDLKLGPAMASVARRRLGHLFECLGHVESDEAVTTSVRRRRPLVAEFPDSKAARHVERIVRRILATEAGTAGSDRQLKAPLLRPEGEETHYEMLETEPGVGEEEIRRAFRRVKEIYAPGGLAGSGLFSDEELAQLHHRFDVAHDTLFSPERRRAYDLGLPEADLAHAVRAAARLSGPRLAERAVLADPVLGPDEEITGATLRRIREARGLDLAEVCQRTRIGERHLRAIEEERYGDLPAPVYVRGYVTTYARTLRLDGTRAADAFLRRYHQARTPTVE